MGKQVGFFMTHEDEKNFLASISRLAPVRLVYQMFADPSHMELEPLEAVGSREGNANLCLVNRTLRTPLKVNDYPQQPSQVDKVESEVVEFRRCEPSKVWLRDGRLWYDERTMHGRKSDAFIKWADSLLRWVHRNYKKDARGFYVAPNALELSKAGKLQLGPSDEPELSLEERKRMLGLQ